ncbi:MAG: exodeoxyribonuclease VII small subunit [Desulfotignum balticum]|jgi:exodeoxyribonuclease VII small subunit|uniref:Exodeoxyribonuclease 7 small subunit n=1 Tax=Desulfotignum balticum TaxID=115781 RepID=A0A931G8S8_9BACT|nr:exodeoxyribonuclease VII small subunit [Desulfotignum balticum]
MAKTTFETALKQLESIVKEMESGDLALEQALKKYETGIEKVRYCMEILDNTEKKITQLTRDLDGSIKETPFDHE